MEIPYGFDCFAFEKNEIKYFEPSLERFRHNDVEFRLQNQTYFEAKSSVSGLSGNASANYVIFTRKNEDYSKEQLQALIDNGRLNSSEATNNKKIFCGIKIQIGIAVVTNFLQQGLQYRPPIKGRSELINGSWTGIVSGLTIKPEKPNSYDLAFGNFLAYDEEFPYIKFGPFFAIESKLVMLTGSSRQIEASSFGTNMNNQVGLIALLLMFILALLASFRVNWSYTKHRTLEETIEAKLISKQSSSKTTNHEILDDIAPEVQETKSLIYLIQNFIFIYITMLLNKPSLEFDELIWPKHHQTKSKQVADNAKNHFRNKDIYKMVNSNKNQPLSKEIRKLIKRRKGNEHLPESIRVLSYLWSAACFVMASVFSGEMLAVILLHTDQNIDTVSQLINSNPPIEPVIRQDDFTYNLMLKSLDQNMLLLHNKTKIIPRPEVYTRRFIESVSKRKHALLGDDELIETIYDIYHKYYPLYKSKVTYLQYPISIMYRKEFNTSLELKLRRGIVQIFEMGLIERWYQAQKDTYIQFYDTYERGNSDKKDKDILLGSASSGSENYKPLSMHNFESFFKLMLKWKAFALFVLLLEIIYAKLTRLY